jgi:hypothetical protein
LVTLSTEVLDDLPPSTLSFHECAAWISLVVSAFVALAAVAVCVFPLFAGEELLSVYLFVFCFSAISFTLGTVSLFGFRRHKRNLTLWFASMGCLIGGGLITAEVVFIFKIISGFGHQ